ncbi:MAG TPA: inositol monophosphatase family protein [Planctomycetaceae bacterium]|jgi:3'(2'), 5'-bisphosphate nucleotidase|nr:inositol monophosphatase family protein [Planctomycetaceae bacterium]
MNVSEVTAALARHLPSVLRWSGALAKSLRGHNIALSGKHSGSANTDALTLADLTIQELIVAALRDAEPALRMCRIEAEETTGDLLRFASEGDLVLAIDPVDGTKQYRDRTGDGYAVMLHLRNRETVLYSLVFVPECGATGAWVEVHDDRVRTGPDDGARPAREVLDGLKPVERAALPESNKIYVIGFQDRDPKRARDLASVGLQGHTSETMAGSIYELMARGEYGGSLIHSPNVYDFPVSLQIARSLGGDALWVRDRRPVHFGETWLDDRANMIRLPGIVACSPWPATLDRLCELARDWNPNRYPPEA